MHQPHYLGKGSSMSGSVSDRAFNRKTRQEARREQAKFIRASILRLERPPGLDGRRPREIKRGFQSPIVDIVLLAIVAYLLILQALPILVQR